MLTDSLKKSLLTLFCCFQLEAYCEIGTNGLKVWSHVRMAVYQDLMRLRSVSAGLREEERGRPVH